MDWSKCLETVDRQQIATISCIPQVFINLINWALVFSGVVGLFFLIWGGIMLITSGGDKTKVDEGKKTLTYAIIGMIVIFLSFFVVRVIAYITGAECITTFGFDSCK